MPKNSFPILYSFRRCPYAMRARLAIASSNIRCELREVVLKDKPAHMIELSPKATVPVLLSAEGKVIDESIEIMEWAWSQHDPERCFQTLTGEQREQTLALIHRNDQEFKYFLDRYKYADRYPEHDQLYYREQAENFLQQLEAQLQSKPFLILERPSWADMAVWPFIRQFAFVDEKAFETLPYPKVQKWLQFFLESAMFANIMHKYPQWHPNDATTWFPES